MKVEIFPFSTARMKINQVSYVIFQAKKSFLLNFTSPLRAKAHNSYEIF